MQRIDIRRRGVVPPVLEHGGELRGEVVDVRVDPEIGVFGAPADLRDAVIHLDEPGGGTPLGFVSEMEDSVQPCTEEQDDVGGFEGRGSGRCHVRGVRVGDNPLSHGRREKRYHGPVDETADGIF